MTRSAPIAARGPFGQQAHELGKSARTRARLMDAATGLFARQGFEAASVNEIAKVAEVANGTFYAHFRDKEEIAGAVAFRIAEEVVRQLDAAMAEVDEAVERTSMATRRFIDLAASEPDWGGALFRAVWEFRDLREGVITYLRADLQRGVTQGAFTTEIDDVLIDTFSSMTLGALFSRLQGTHGPEAACRVAELQLRMLGVPAARAKAAAWREIPPLRLTIIPLAKGG
ncbi:TetR/AcrR family transcriptional regulator [Phenylobacterium aquaticum]|uniref:TetR/AcrR family transcriptional regulator n=1 Tax=Phenylobacterium aquaticum TaxID=1763816 RepID=UPI001F5C326B|nr:TetR/AcrR family transcriptional regulator [Phenylobacterium aquaticum]MCI3134654.1 TetR/AcrR family transcriptional regulator [Phenylobacterium aquaticum]